METALQASSNPAGNNLSVLVIDDQRANRVLLSRLLTRLGYTCHEAPDGASGIALLEQITPDIILIDLVMPIMDGFATTQAIRRRAQFTSTPIIAISALEDIDSIVKAIGAGADDYLVKPIHFDILGAKLRRLSENIFARRHRAELEARNQAIGEAIPDAMITINEQGIIEWANAITVGIFGYPLPQLIGKNVSCLMPEPYRSAHDSYLARFVDTGEARVLGTRRRLRAMHADGHTFPIELAVVPLQIGGQRHFLGIIRDLTEAERLESMKQNFISVINHELRTPLTSILGSLSLLSAGVAGELPAKALRMVDMAERNGKRLGRLINDIVDLDKIDSGAMRLQLRSQPLLPLLQDALQLSEGAARRAGIELKLAVDSQKLAKMLVRVDGDRLQQVLGNLLSNAIKFSPAGSQIEIAATADKHAVRISVQDQGTGIPAEFQSRIFQRFAQHERADVRQREGSGLGLSIAKALVEQMAGSIDYTTVPGQGSCFHFTLPLIHGEPAGEEKNAAA